MLVSVRCSLVSLQSTAAKPENKGCGRALLFIFGKESSPRVGLGGGPGGGRGRLVGGSSWNWRTAGLRFRVGASVLCLCLEVRTGAQREGT